MELYICDWCYYLILHCIWLLSIASISFNFSSMALNKVTLISDLDVLLESYKLKVKIIRLWKQTVRGNPKETYAIEMILMDEQGNKIQAKVWKQCVSKFENLLEEKGDFYIEKPQLASNDSPYKYADNRYKLTFNWVTKVTKCTDFNGPDTNFAFATFPSISADEPKKDCTIDVIGEVLQCFEMEYHMINGIRTKKQNVEVRDLELLSKAANDSSSSQRSTSSSIVYSLHNEFVHKFPFSSIANIQGFKKEQSVIILGTIEGIRKDAGWYYHACNKCTRKVEKMVFINDTLDDSTEVEEKEVFKCTNLICKDETTTVTPRFRIQVRVQDCTGIVSLTLFDREVKRITQKNVKDLLEKDHQLGDVNIFPDELDDVIGKKLAFKISITEFNLENHCTIYGVTKLTDDQKVISELHKHFPIQQSVEIDSSNVEMSDFQSQETVTMKDDGSSTGDNTTPVSANTNASNEPGRVISKHVDLKRNLEDVYDVDAPVGMSSTKPRTTRIGDGEGHGSKKLLIPKIEK